MCVTRNFKNYMQTPSFFGIFANFKPVRILFGIFADVKCFLIYVCYLNVDLIACLLCIMEMSNFLSPYMLVSMLLNNPNSSAKTL